MQLKKLPEREENLGFFLNQHGYAGAEISPISGDASFRHYYRLLKSDGSKAILMDAPPTKEDVRPFVKVAEYLLSHGIHAPTLIAKDETDGFLLLEDFGNTRYKEHIEAHPEDADTLYKTALDVLVHLKGQSLCDLPPYDTDAYMKEVLLLTEWYSKLVNIEMDTNSYKNIWQTLLETHPLSQSIVVLRDYHAENLMWLEGEGISRVGQLDFQDALIGDPVYDVVSLLEDARRDVSCEFAEEMIAHYLEKTGEDKDTFMLRYHLLGAQRNCKIIGIFARLALRDRKPIYLQHLPRMFGYLERDLSHPALEELRKWIAASIPQNIQKSVPEHE